MAENQMASHEIHLSFDLKHQIARGTSRISLPPGMPLTLKAGPLKVTGAVLNRPDAEALVLQADGDNRLVLAAEPVQRSLFISWEMQADEPMQSDNLISAKGITLAGFWHPLPDRDMLYTVIADIPRTFVAVTEADEIHETMRSGGRRIEGRFSHPLPGVHFVAGPYTVKKRRVSKSLTLYTYFFPEDKQLAKEYLEQAVCYLQRYEKLIGPYPYSRFSIVENRLPTGYGMPGYTLLGQAVVRLPFIKDTSLGHEILHSWFGNSVFVDEKGGNWCEGLTTYLADQAYAQDKGEGAAYRKNQLLRYAAYVSDDNTMRLIDFKHSADNRSAARKIRTIGYDKGSMLFHMLRGEIGDQDFFAGLRRFYETWKYKRAGWDDIEEVFSAVTGRDLHDFFEMWLKRSDIPALRVGNIDWEQSADGFSLSFKLIQNNENPYKLKVPVVVETVLDSHRKQVHLEEKESKVSMAMDSVPLSLTIDPEYDLMRKLTERELVATWAAFVGSADKKVVLADGGEDVYAPLLPMLRKMGCTEIKESELANKDLQQGSYIFLGPTVQSRSLFGPPETTASGMVVDVRKNPLAPGEVIVMIWADSAKQVVAVSRKLNHYGKYSYLRFEDGRLREKRIAPSDAGIVIELGEEPAGMAVSETRGFADIIAELGRNRVVYIGETHTDYGNHLLQLEIIQGLYRLNPKLAVGMEMFPRKVQPILDDYVQGRITDEKEFLKKSGYFSGWGYDYRFYRPIINFAVKNRIPLVALNLQKNIVSSIFRKGHTDDLTNEQKALLPPERDLDLPGYRERLSQIHAMHGGGMGGPHKQRFSGFIQAQALWDETMAQSVVDYPQAHPGSKMVVLAGTGHVYRDSAIPPRVARRLDVSQVSVASMYSGEQGRKQGKKLDYLLYTESVRLPPAPKIGVILSEEQVKEKGKDGKTTVVTRMRVAGISPHGGAGEAGIRKKDIILSVDGIPVTTIDDIKIALIDKKAGDIVKVKIKRENTLLPDRELTLDVKLSSMSGGKPPGHP